MGAGTASVPGATGASDAAGVSTPTGAEGGINLTGEEAPRPMGAEDNGENSPDSGGAAKAATAIKG